MTFIKQTVQDVDVHGRTVLLRADYNLPLNEDGTIADDFRLQQSLPTLHYLLEQGCKVVICSHLGRPKGKADKALSLEPVSQRLANLMNRPVHFVPDCVGDIVAQTVKNITAPALILLENLRFHAQEEQNDEAFAERLAKDSQAAYFVQDGFGVVHRAHASTSAITQFLPSVAGLLLEKEVSILTTVRDNPKRPLVAVLGGAKIADKLPLVQKFLSLADKVIIGGAIANTIFKWEGYQIGKSKVDNGMDAAIDELARGLCQDLHDHKSCLRRSEKLLLPQDVAVGGEPSEAAVRENKPLGEVLESDYILDMGDRSIETMLAALQGAGMVLWNGTLGITTYPNFAHGSARLALWLAQHKAQTKSIIGGGDTADFVLGWAQGDAAAFTHISTGGGASLELLSGQKLPGVEALLPR